MDPNKTINVLLGGGGLGGLATAISGAVNGNGTPGGTADSAQSALVGGPPAPTPANPTPGHSVLASPMVLIGVAVAGLIVLILAVRGR